VKGYGVVPSPPRDNKYTMYTKQPSLRRTSQKEWQYKGTKYTTKYKGGLQPHYVSAVQHTRLQPVCPSVCCNGRLLQHGLGLIDQNTPATSALLIAKRPHSVTLACSPFLFGPDSTPTWAGPESDLHHPCVEGDSGPS